MNKKTTVVRINIRKTMAEKKGNLLCGQDIHRRIVRPLGEDGSGKREGSRTSHPSFGHYMQCVIQKMRDRGNMRTAETYRAALKSFLAFLHNRDIQPERVSPDLVAAYESWLKTKAVSLNTVSFYMRILRATYNRAVREELTADRHPFRQAYTGVAKTAKRGLSTDDISRILHLDLSAYPSAAFARDIFLFSFYTCGMSLVDIAKLRKENVKNGVLTYQRSKTGRRLSVKWRPEMQRIVERYHRSESDRLLPIIKSETDIRKQYDTALHRINYNLKKLGRTLGLPIPLTMYVARHSWADAARRSDVPLPIISQCLGHNSEQTTQIYLSEIDIDQKDEANDKILRKVMKK